MKRLFLITTLLFILTLPMYSQYYCRRYTAYPRRIVVHREVPVYVTVKNHPKIVVLEEETEPNIIYSQKNESIKYTDEYDDILNVQFEDDNKISYDQMWKQTIWFKEDRYEINKEYNKVTLDNVAKFLYDNPSANINIYGYASKKHGSYMYNKQLAANRCQETKLYLMHTYNIDSERISMIVKGTDSPEYYVDKWNQCVVIKCK